MILHLVFFVMYRATPENYTCLHTRSLRDSLPIYALSVAGCSAPKRASTVFGPNRSVADWPGWNCGPASPIICKLPTGAPAASSSARASALAFYASTTTALPAAKPRGVFSPARTLPPENGRAACREHVCHDE